MHVSINVWWLVGIAAIVVVVILTVFKK